MICFLGERWKKETKPWIQPSHIKPQLKLPVRSRGGSWVQIPSGTGIFFPRISVDAISIFYLTIYWMRFSWYIIINVEVGFINVMLFLKIILWLFWISQKPNLINALLYMERKRKLNSCFFFLADGKQHKAREFDMISLRNHHAPRSYITWLRVTSSVLDMIIV